MSLRQYQLLKEEELNEKLFLIEDWQKIVQDSFFLYDKSNLIKKPFIAELNKHIALYGAISYFAEKEEKIGINIDNSKNKLLF